MTDTEITGEGVFKTCLIIALIMLVGFTWSIENKVNQAHFYKSIDVTDAQLQTTLNGLGSQGCDIVAYRRAIGSNDEAVTEMIIKCPN